MTDPSHGQTGPPLYVDLDGTLVATDTLIVNIRLLVRRQPWLAPVLPLFVLAGRSSFKERLASRVAIDPAKLPYRRDVLGFLETEKEGGRSIVLATAAHHLVAGPVARYVGIFDDVIASDRAHNLKGRAKLGAILKHAGGGDFCYMGDSMADLPILQAASSAYLVHPSDRLLKAARESCRIERIFD
jgi:phosphoserine phosphatase